MPFLVVTGRGSWNHAGTPYRPGVHEVSQEIADAASESRIKSLFVTDLEPEIMRQPDTYNPLSLEDIKVGTNHGIRMQRGAAEPVEEEGPEGRVFEFPCPFCPKQMMSSGSLNRHVEFHHEVLA